MTVFKLGTKVKDFFSDLNANFAELLNKPAVGYTVLYDGSAEIPSKQSGETNTITLNADITQFDGVIIQRDGGGAWQRFENIEVGTVFEVMNGEADFVLVEGCNLFMCNAEVVSGTKLKLSNNVYSGVRMNATARYMENFGDYPLTKVIGIKL